MEGYLAEIRGFAANFNPRNWAGCDGQLLAISQNQALYSLIGTIYGGDGRTTFGLPDLRGRSPLQAGQGPGLSNVSLGQTGGVQYATMQESQMPQHTHAVVMHARREDGAGFNPSGSVLASDAAVTVYSNGTPDVTMSASAATTTMTGASQDMMILNPFLAIRMVICTSGIFPSRN